MEVHTCVSLLILASVHKTMSCNYTYAYKCMLHNTISSPSLMVWHLLMGKTPPFFPWTEQANCIINRKRPYKPFHPICLLRTLRTLCWSLDCTPFRQVSAQTCEQTLFTDTGAHKLISNLLVLCTSIDFIAPCLCSQFRPIIKFQGSFFYSSRIRIPLYITKQTAAHKIMNKI